MSKLKESIRQALTANANARPKATPRNPPVPSFPSDDGSENGPYGTPPVDVLGKWVFEVATVRTNLVTQLEAIEAGINAVPDNAPRASEWIAYYAAHARACHKQIDALDAKFAKAREVVAAKAQYGRKESGCDYRNRELEAENRRLKAEKKSAEEESEEGSEDETEPDLSWLPDPDKVYGEQKDSNSDSEESDDSQEKVEIKDNMILWIS